MRYSVVASTLLSSLLASASARAQLPVWRADLNDDIQGMTVSTAGALIVQTKSTVSALSADSGKTLWSRSDISSLGVLPGSPFARARVRDAQRIIDLASGKDRWDMASLSLADPMRSVVLPERGLILVYGPSAKSRMTLLGVSLDSGVVRWRQDSLLPPSVNKLQEIAGHASGVMVGDTAVVLDVD